MITAFSILCGAVGFVWIIVAVVIVRVLIRTSDDIEKEFDQ